MDQLIQELLAGPDRFCNSRKDYQLLQASHEEHASNPVEQLRPLMAHPQTMVRRVAVFVASEWGIGARDLIDEAISRLDDEDPYISCCAVQILMACSEGKDTKVFAHVVRALAHKDRATREEAMYLVSNANESRLKVAIQLPELSRDQHGVHKTGLRALLVVDRLSRDDVLALLDDPEPVARKYGAIAAQKLQYKWPHLIAVASSSEDTDISEYLAFQFIKECACEKNPEDYVHVVRALHSRDSKMRRFAMGLFFIASESQLRVASQSLDYPSDKRFPSGKRTSHEIGLGALLDIDRLSRDDVLALLNDPEPLVRKYGVIAAHRLEDQWPQLLEAACLSGDAEVSEYAKCFYPPL